MEEYVPLHLACEGADIHATDEFGNTPLHMACKKTGNAENVNSILTAGADIHTTNNDGNTPLYLACRNTGNTETVKVLLTAGADIHTKNKNGNTPLHLACRKTDNTETVKVLLTAGADIHTKNKNGNTPLHLTCRNTGYTETAKVLLTAGADIHSTNTDGNTPLHLACANTGNTETVNVLLTAGADIHSTNNAGDTPLHLACANTGNTETVNVLLTAGADIHSTNNDGNTPLHLACANTGNTETVNVLLAAGVDIHTIDRYGHTPLHVACSTTGNTETVKVLLTAGADIHDTDIYGHTPLMGACSTTGNIETVKVLLTAGADINIVDKFGSTALHVACELSSHYSTIQYLLSNGALVNAVDNDGRTPLYYLMKYLSKQTFSLCSLRSKFYLMIIWQLFKCCYIRNICSAMPVSNELNICFYWAGDRGKAIFDVLSAEYTKAEVVLFTQIYLANNPLSVYTETGFRNISLELQSRHKSNSLQIQQIMNQLDERKQTFPSLKELVRSVLRRKWSCGGYSILGRASALAGEIPHNLIEFLFMYEEAWNGLPAFTDDIEYHFKREQPEDLILLHIAMTTCKQINRPEWILADIVGSCPQVKVEDISCPVSIQQELSLMQQRLNVSTLLNNEKRITTTTIERLLKTFLNLLCGKNVIWRLKPCGSFYLGNKIEEFDEVDYLAVLQSLDIRIGQVETNLEYDVTIPMAHLHGLGLHLKEYITEALKMYLKDEIRPENPANGKVFFRTTHPHTHGPGVCAQMAWMCPRGHTHDVGVDLSPTVQLEGLTLGDVWMAPAHFSKSPFFSIKQDLLDLPVYLVSSTRTPESTNEGNVTSKWKITYNNTKPLMFSCLDRTSFNIRRVFHLIKYIKQFLPRKLGFTLETEDIQGSWKHGSLISSYVLYNILLQEVLLHPTPANWSDTNLVVRLRGALEAVSRWTYIDFFKDRREDSFTLTDFNDVQQKAFGQMMERQMDRMTDVLETMENNYSGECTMDGASTDQTLRHVQNKVQSYSYIYTSLFTSICQCVICIHIIYLSII